jgi:hypothetical protein
MKKARGRKSRVRVTLRLRIFFFKISKLQLQKSRPKHQKNNEELLTFKNGDAWEKSM